MRRSTDGQRAVRTAAAGALAALCAALAWGMMTLATEPLEPCTPTSTSVCSGVPMDHSTNGTGKDYARPCPTEDSVACTWNAAEQGNGTGRSYVVDAVGNVTFLP